jgi:adenine-specific DNA-methyltransferase
MKKKGSDHKFILCTNNENNICEQVTFNRIKNIITGYVSDENETIKGIEDNLKYLKTDFVKIDTVNDNLRRKMVDRITEILCLKENTFNLYNDLYSNIKSKMFENKDKYTAILFDTFYFEEFVDELKKLKDKSVSIYVFSHTNTFPREEFGDLSMNFTVEAIPEKILETYKKIFNF